MKLRELSFFALLVFAGCVSENLDILDENTKVTEINSVHTKSLDEQSYYWHNDTKVYITPTENSYVILRDTCLIDIDSYLQVVRLSETDVASLQSDIFVLDNPEDGHTQYGMKLRDIELDLLQDDVVVYSAPYYILPSGVELGLSELFLVKLKSESDYHLLETFANEHNVCIVASMSRPLWYKLSCTINSTGNALEMANVAYESGMFANSEAIFVNAIKFNIDSYNDPGFVRQWNLDSGNSYSINLDGTHDITTGNSDILVAVIDTGFQLDHPDIDLLSGWDATHQSIGARLYDYSNPGYTHHGTGTAGVIGANINNGTGIVGIAPEVSILPISVHMDGSAYRNTHESIVDAIAFAVEQKADVISNSWSADSPSSYIREAIYDALNEGRDGKGCVVVFASGNNGSQESSYPHADIPSIISVGNTNAYGYRYSTSNYGPDLDIVAPGTKILTLCSGSAYMEASGTSFSCPHVSAVAALMLSVNPNLTQSEVGFILDITATKIDTYDFVTRLYDINTTWNEEVGYGLLNCYDAVNLAYSFNEDKYLELIEFDHSGNIVELSLTVKDNIAIIWDENVADISFIHASPTSPVDTTITHTYKSFGIRSIKVVETTVPGEIVPSSSAAITKFDFVADNYTSNIDIKPVNTALEYVMIMGCSGIASQEISIKDLPSLTELYLVHMPDIDVSVDNCPSLLRFGSSKYIWGAPVFDFDPIFPIPSMNDESLDSIDDEIQSLEWPAVPESIKSFRTLSITDCENLAEISLENVNIGPLNLSDFPNLRYIYVSSDANGIVGGGSSLFVNGQYLYNTILTLPDRPSLSKGLINIRGISADNSQYIAPAISTSVRTMINLITDNKNWRVVYYPQN